MVRNGHGRGHGWMAVALIVFVALAPLGCDTAPGSGDGATDTGGGDGPVEVGVVTPAGVVEITSRIEGLRGKVVLVDLWATWCEPCKDEFPKVVALHESLADRGLAVVSVSLDDPDDRDTVAAFVTERRARFETLLSTGKHQALVPAMDDEWGGGIPCMILYDRRGKRVRLAEGEEPLEQMRDDIQKLLDKQR